MIRDLRQSYGKTFDIRIQLSSMLVVHMRVNGPAAPDCARAEERDGKEKPGDKKRDVNQSIAIHVSTTREGPPAIAFAYGPAENLNPGASRASSRNQPDRTSRCRR